MAFELNAEQLRRLDEAIIARGAVITRAAV